MDISKLRKRVGELDRRRRRLQSFLLRPRPMTIGSLYEIYKKCGNLRCKCGKGKRHGPFMCLSFSIGGRHKMVFVRKKDQAVISKQAANYCKYQKWMAEIRKINEEVFEILKQIREAHTRQYK